MKTIRNTTIILLFVTLAFSLLFGISSSEAIEESKAILYDNTNYQTPSRVILQSDSSLHDIDFGDKTESVKVLGEPRSSSTRIRTMGETPSHLRVMPPTSTRMVSPTRHRP